MINSRENGEDIRISAGSSFTNLTENMGIQHVSTKFIPWIMMPAHQEN
jgi:hypothetical protein